MPDLQTEFNSCLFHSSSALHRKLERTAEKHFKEVGLTPTQGFILMTVKEAPGVSISDLALVHQVVNSTITRMVKALEDMGFVIREGIRPFVRVFATEEGLHKSADARAAWQKLRLEYEQLIGREKARHIADQITSALRALG